ncbi:hypothetical protein WJT86_07680 [Microvirga sp. W0021]|uniref:Uncharacterized protein n=1 Tax=Hohaiivirga grylli TaxID=3133970 RepID=A0ABV0BM96_9HYPH
MRLFLSLLLSASLISFTPALSVAQTAAKKPEVQKGQTEKVISPGQLAARERQKTCGVEWKKIKGTKAADGKAWPQFWSECNKRLKGQQA